MLGMLEPMPPQQQQHSQLLRVLCLRHPDFQEWGHTWPQGVQQQEQILLLRQHVVWMRSAQQLHLPLLPSAL